MYMRVEDFIADWKHESAATQRLLETLTDESLQQPVGPNQRTLGQLAWHIATTIYEMLTRTGLQLPAPQGEEAAPASAAVIAGTYRKQGEALVAALQNQWTDAVLQETNDMYGEQWPKGLTLLIFLRHEIHHRGQMTILMRQAGLRVAGVYGPSRDEWIDMGEKPLI